MAAPRLREGTMFTQSFGKFVCDGDKITCLVDRFTATATVYRDESGDTPEQRDEGFWPSRDPNAAGYVLPKNFKAEMARAKRVLAAWEADQWFYCGVAVTVECEGITLLGQYDCALWGIECNYPDSDNAYLGEVANELLGEAIEQAKAKIAKLCKGV